MTSGEQQKMKAAYLITAHHQPKHLARLIDALQCDWATFFIHIDKKEDITQFHNVISPSENVLFLKNNRRVIHYRGSFTHVRASLNLLQAAIDFHVPFYRYCLLSGADFPIKTKDHIYTQLKTKKEFIRIDHKPSESPNPRHYKNVSRLWFQQIHAIEQWSGKITRPTYRKIDLYFGSAWWALTDPCARYIIDFKNTNRDYIWYHKLARNPDEMFYHSIIQNSPFAPYVTHNADQNHAIRKTNEHGSHYIDWLVKNVRLPKVLTMSDLNVLLESQALFARKFEEEQSKELLDELEKHVL